MLLVAKTFAADENPFLTADERAEQLGKRTWTDASGKFSLEAKLVKVDDGKVTLRKEDGKEVILPVEKLSASDRQVLAELKANPAGGAEKKEAARDPAEAPRVETPNFAAAPSLDPFPPEAWTYVPDEPSSKSRIPDLHISLGKSVEFHDYLRGHYVSPEAGKAVLAYENAFGNGKTKVIVCDLKKKSVEGVGPFVDGYKPLGASSDLTKVAGALIGDFHSTQNQIVLFDVKQNRTIPTTIFYPFGKEDSWSQVDSALYLDNKHLLTYGFFKGVVCWELGEPIRPMYRCENSFTHHVAYSASRKYMALPQSGRDVSQGIMIYEAATGNRAGFLPVEDMEPGFNLSFSNSGKKLAAVGGGRILVWDLTTQKLEREFASVSQSSSGVLWLDEDFILVDGRDIIDLPHRVVVWHYNGLGESWQEFGKIWYIKSIRNDTMLVGASALPKGAKELLRGVDPEAMIVIKPGVSIDLDVQLDSYPQHTEAVRISLGQQLEKKGFKVDPASNLRLFVNIRPGDRKEITYQQRNGPNHGNVSVQSYNVQIASVELQKDGTTVWSHKHEINAPYFLHLKQAETIEENVQKSMEESGKHIDRIWIPNYVAVLPPGKVAGQSGSPGMD